MSRISKIKRRVDEEDRRTLMTFGAIIIVVAGIFVGIMSNSAYASGWEITSSLDQVTIETETFEFDGEHNMAKDIDGSFEDKVAADGYTEGRILVDPKDYDIPGITIESSYPYYLQRTDSGDWVESDDAWLLDKYTIPGEITPDTEEFYSYNHWVVGVDVTMKTDAEKINKPFGIYADYGYYYEDQVADVEVRQDVSVNPWTPTGTSNNWTITDGWSGIMSASVADLSYGLVSEGATENKGHTIQNLHSVGSALNMYGGESADFSDPGQLEGVPSSVDIEVGASLGAGAEYTTDLTGHWNSLSVRNVFVKYTIRVDVLSTLKWSLQTGHQGDMDEPEENNTNYQPEITPWKQFVEDLKAFLQDPFVRFMTIVVLIVIGLAVVAVILI